ncbi:MAG: thiamine phosphate synthase, partial [Methyloceanibacter sp.]
MPLTAKLEAQLAQTVQNTDAACVLFCRNGEPIDEIHADRLIDLVQSAGLACLIESDVGLAERLGADGVHIDADAATYTGARGRLGTDANIGAGCGSSRHDAMLLAEMGADYIAFGPGWDGDIDWIAQC